MLLARTRTQPLAVIRSLASSRSVTARRFSDDAPDTSSIIPTTNLYRKSSIGGGLFYNSQGRVDWRLFYQRNDGGLNGMVKDQGPGREAVSGRHVRLGTPIVTLFHTSRIGSGSTTFYIDNYNQVSVFSVSSNFNSQGPLKDAYGRTFVARADSQLGAFSWVVNNTAHIRIAYQLENNHVHQINWDGNANFIWTNSYTSPATLHGTSMSFINQSPAGQDQFFRGYYQHTNYSILELINLPDRGYVGPFHQSLDHRTRIAASFPAQTGNHKFPRANGQVSVFWVNNDHTVSRRILNNHHWSGIQHLSSRIKVSPGGGLLAWSWVPPNAQRPVHERLNWVGSDGHLHQYST